MSFFVRASSTVSKRHVRSCRACLLRRDDAEGAWRCRASCNRYVAASYVASCVVAGSGGLAAEWGAGLLDT